MPALREPPLGLLAGLPHLGQVGLAHRDDLRARRERGVELRQLGVDGVEVGERLAAFAGVDRDEVQERARALDVLEKADAEPRALGRARG